LRYLRDKCFVWSLFLVVLTAIALVGIEAGPAEATGRNIDGCELQPATTCPRVFIHSTSLSNLDLHGSDFQSANFFVVEFRQTVFSGSNMTGARFRNSTFLRTDFSGANLIDTDWLDSDETREADFHGADLRRAHLDDVTFNSAEMRGADLRQVRIGRSTSFTEADLTDADLRDATGDVTYALRNATLCNTTMPDGSKSNRNCKG
jgi:uncharacterized protein YjbI with pentapeptide repeats